MQRSTIVGRFAGNGQILRRFRKRAGFSQERLALAVGTTRRHMIRLENGEHLPSSVLRDRLADALNVDRKTIQASDDAEEEEAALSRDVLAALRPFARLLHQIEEQA